MNAFHIQPIHRFQGSSAVIRRPKEIACFSYDDHHRYHPDERSLRYYYPAPLGADLSRGFESFRRLDDAVDGHLDSLLETLARTERESGERCEADIVTWRGMMTRIMATPYDFANGSGFEMNATLFQGTIFIEENHEFRLRAKDRQRSQQTPSGTPSQDLMTFWGYKFETLSLLPDTWDATPREFIESREDHVVDNHAQYCSVVKTGIGRARLILGGEVDAIWDSKPKPANRGGPINWVELKTSARIDDDRGALRYERKLIKFWIQSFLLGVPKIVVGFRGPTGILERLDELDTHAIPGLVKRAGRASWDGNVCINFAAAFLDWLKQAISSEGVWRISRADRSHLIHVFKVAESGHGGVLSDDFVAWRLSDEAAPAPPTAAAAAAAE